MRIPPSAIVMSLVAAVPFSLAIRDTIIHRDRVLQRERAVETQAQSDRDLEAAREQQIAADQAIRDAQRRTKAAQLIGKEFVTPGPAFGGLRLGGLLERNPLGAVTLDASRTILAMSGSLDDDDAGCGTLADVAARTWGEPAHDHVWLDLTTHQRASIGPDCSVTFARFDEPIAWVAELPLAAIGGSATEIAKRFAPADADPDSGWVAPGLDGDQVTMMWPVYDVAHPDKLLGLEISTSATPQTRQRVIEALTARLGAKPTLGGQDDVYRWKSLELEHAGDDLRIVLGAGER